MAGQGDRAGCWALDDRTTGNGSRLVFILFCALDSKVATGVDATILYLQELKEELMKVPQALWTPYTRLLSPGLGLEGGRAWLCQPPQCPSPVVTTKCGTKWPPGFRERSGYPGSSCPGGQAGEAAHPQPRFSLQAGPLPRRRKPPHSQPPLQTLRGAGALLPSRDWCYEHLSALSSLRELSK